MSKSDRGRKKAGEQGKDIHVMTMTPQDRDIAVAFSVPPIINMHK